MQGLLRCNQSNVPLQNIQNTAFGANAFEASIAQHGAYLLAQHNALLAKQHALFIQQRELMENTLRCQLLATIGAPPGLELEQPLTSLVKSHVARDSWEQSTTCSSRQPSPSQSSGILSNSGDPALRHTSVGDEGQKTMIIKNLVRDCTRDMLFNFLNEHFEAEYDLVYLPRCFASKRSFQYAFVNFVSADAAFAFQARFHGCTDVEIFGGSTADISLSECQGLSSNIAKFRNSSVMHPSVPDECRPLLFRDGKPIAFPKPTKKIKEDRRTRKGAQELQEK